MSLAAGLHLFAGAALVAFWYLYGLVLPFRLLPQGVDHLATHPAWSAISMLGGAGATLAVVAWARLWVDNATVLGLGSEVALMTAMIGLVLLAGNLFWEAILWPPIAENEPALLAFDGPIYRSRLLLAYFAIAGLLFAVGYVVLAFTFPAERMPLGARICLGVGAPLFALGPLFGRLQTVLRGVGISLVALGHGWLALSISIL